MNIKYKLKQLFTPPIKKLPADDFIRRLRSLVIGEGMLLEGNIYLMDYAIKHMPKGGHIVEIGSYGGLSANLILHLMQKYSKDVKLFCCDAWIYEGYHDHLGHISQHIDGREDILRVHYSEYMKTAFIQAGLFLHPNNLPYAFHMYSHDFFSKWGKDVKQIDVFGRESLIDGMISFAYIDGGHSYEVAWSDFEEVSKRLMPGGFILFDDSADHLSFGSASMMQKIKKNKEFKVVGKNPNYLIQKI